jgi:hypothetical protein
MPQCIDIALGDDGDKSVHAKRGNLLEIAIRSSSPSLKKLRSSSAASMFDVGGFAVRVSW